MGQQQLLLVILGLIIVGIAIILGITYFRSSAIEIKRDYLISECVNLAALAQQHYLRPAALGGGGRKFDGWSIPDELKTSSNGSFSATVYSDSVILIATGNELATDTDSIRVKLAVYPTNYQATVIY